MDIMKDECSLLKLQLKERDELISQLQEELEKAQHLQKAFASRADKSTQTELLGCDAQLTERSKNNFLGVICVIKTENRNARELSMVVKTVMTVSRRYDDEKPEEEKGYVPSEEFREDRYDV
ncbi:Protein FAM190A [Fukomys damarensis]|uniref:Protein FAM190A n=1 Tax=Fukomys damarensis TaxID=885580 RepID=A0A091ELE8_FUKDA|nr:Protein FAM190A [Fukomys damarensis]